MSTEEPSSRALIETVTCSPHDLSETFVDKNMTHVVGSSLRTFQPSCEAACLTAITTSEGDDE